MTLDDEMTEAVDDRMRRLAELSRRRSASRKATRERLTRRRAAGLRKRHEQKISRQENDQ